jgi:hypothetical protein
MIGVPHVLRRPGAKRRRGNPAAAANLPNMVFVASPDHGPGDGERRWVLRGFCGVSSIEAIDTPSSNQQKIIDEMELHRSARYDKYEIPVELRVVRSGLLSQPFIVDLQSHAQFCKLPADAVERVGNCVITATGDTILHSFGRSFREWPVWKHTSALPASVCEDMRHGLAFAWPAFPGEVCRIGLEMPETQLHFNRPCYEMEGSSGESEGGQGEPCPEGATSAMDPYPAAKMLACLVFSSFLRSPGDFRKALAVAAKLLDVAPEVVEGVVIVRHDDGQHGLEGIR